MSDKIRNLHNQIRCELVSTMEQLMHANAIKAICFMEEHGVDAKYVFDGNDLHATHVIVYAADEPIGTVRIRWFRDFAKCERMSIRKKWRNPDIMKIFTDFIFLHVAKKGFDRVYTHATPRYAKIWQRYLGFKVVKDKPFWDHDEKYVELVKHLDVPDDAIGENTPIQILYRNEGQWDQETDFERELK